MTSPGIRRWTDEFNRTAGAMGSDWTIKTGSNPVIATGGTFVNANTSGFFPAEFKRSTAGPDQYCSTTILTTNSTDGQALFVRGSGTATAGTLPFLYFCNGAFQICTMTDWAGGGFTTRATAASQVVAANDFIEFKVISNVYTGTRNGVVQVTWNDSGAIASQAGRFQGLICQNSDAARFDRFTSGDARPMPLYPPNQALMRATIY